MRQVAGWVGLLAATLLAGCAATMPSMEIRSDRNPAGNFAAYATYAWTTPPMQAPAWSAHDDRVSFDWQVRGLVDQQMARLGYASVPAGQSDLLLGYGVRTEEESMNDTWGSYAMYRAEGGTQSAGTAWVMGYERGTLVIDATDARTRQLVWFGQASAVVNPSLPEQRLPQAIARIFASFPPRTAP
jgi:hypothetical protein